MKKMLYKIAIITSLVLFAGWDGAYAEEPAFSQGQGFLAQILSKDFFAYALFCGLVSILIKLVDYVIGCQIDMTNPNTPQQEIMAQAVPLLGWFVSATIVGYLGIITGFLTTTPQTAVMVGIAWPMVYARLKTAMAQNAIEKQAEVGILPDSKLGEEQETTNDKAGK